jgi:hypothetical protein
MTRHLSLLFLYLLLFATACKKEDVKPSLEGRWNYHSSTAYYYDRDGKLLDEVTSVWGTHYIIVTGRSVQYLSSIDDKLLSASQITQQGEILRTDGKPQTVSKLTFQNLSLLDKTATAGIFGGTVALANHYVR